MDNDQQGASKEPPMGDAPKSPPGEESGKSNKPEKVERLLPGNDGRFNLKRTQIPQSKPMPPPVRVVGDAEDDPDRTPVKGSPVLPPAGNDPYDGGEATVVGGAAPAPASNTDVPAWMGGEATVVGTGTSPGTPAKDQPYAGTEATLLGMPASGQPRDAAWAGADDTIVGKQQAADTEPATAWSGAEATQLGIPAGAKPVTDNGGVWVGNEATSVGAPVDPELQAQVNRSGSPVGKSVTKTTTTMDDGWHLKGRKGPMTGTLFGDYEIGGILGEGGMGTVYRARQVSLKRRVALKVLPAALSHDMRLRERFEAEARTASLINSPHVVSVFAAGTIDDISYFVMEYVEGTDLSEVIIERQNKNELFPAEEAADIIIQAARGLTEAAKVGIVHRDIKPANLMVTKRGVIKIADFGISKVAGEHGLTMTGTAVGTPSYCSPEQGRGDPVDPRSDIYSLGVVLYELLTGKKPFEGATANALIYQHNYGEPKMPCEIRPDLAEAYQAVALKCLQKSPENRYQDASELAGDLERVRAGSAPMTALLSAFGTGADEAMKRLGIRQRKTWPWVLAATVALGTMGGSYWYWQADRDARIDSRKTRDELRAKLSQTIDASLEWDDSVPIDLAAYVELVGDDDADVLRWRAEELAITQLEGRLTSLDAAGLPDATVRSQSAVDMIEYAKYVGESGQNYVRWTAELDRAQQREVALRTQLRASIDNAARLTLSDVESLTPTVAEASQLMGPEDSDAVRWADRLTRVTNRAESLRGNLVQLDTAASGIPERDLASLSADLETYSELAGPRDLIVQQRTAQLASARAVLHGLRQSLTRLDSQAKNGVVSQGLVAQVGEDQARYATLADPEDPQLRRWHDIIDASNKRVAALETELARLDAENTVFTQVEQRALSQVLTDYAELVGTAHPSYQRWGRRLAQESARLTTDLQALTRLDDQRRLTLPEVVQLMAAVDRLEMVGGIEPLRSQSVRARIEAGRQYVESLRSGIAAREGADGFTLDKDLGDRILEFVDLAGSDDVDAKRWKTVAGQYFRLHTALEVLDQPLPIPDRIDSYLTDYAALVGSDEDVRRWTAKVHRVRELKIELAAVDAIAPLPERALENSTELVRLVGDQDLEAHRWHGKVARVTELFTTLVPQLVEPQAMVLDPDRVRVTAVQVRELRDVIGLKGERADALALREAILEGPPKPTWAREFGRDTYGLYATAMVNNARLRFRYIPAGMVRIGSPESERGRDADEGQQPMTISRSYWLAENETHQGFVEALRVEHKSRFRSAERPVERVSFADVEGIIQALNAQVSGLQARLPTEMEWEYACRAGVEGPFHGAVPTADALVVEDIAWYGSNSGGSTRPVAGRYPNRLGLFDMHGNVWEWCADAYVAYSPALTEDWLGRGSELRVVRGGSWADDREVLRAANRLGIDPKLRTLYVGFRIAAPIDWGDDQGYDRLRTMSRGLVIRGDESAEQVDTQLGEDASLKKFEAAISMDKAKVAAQEELPPSATAPVFEPVVTE